MHPYLQTADGSPVNRKVIVDMSNKAQMLWRSLDAKGLAPTTFGCMTDNMWTYFLRLMLADAKYDFLLLCDDMEWKLRKWCVLSYSSWYTKWQVHKIKSQLEKAEAAVKLDTKGILEDPGLLCIRTGSDDHSIGEDCDNKDGDDEDVRNSPAAKSSPPLTILSPLGAPSLTPTTNLFKLTTTASLMPTVTAPSPLNTQAGNSLSATAPSSLDSQTGNLLSTTAPSSLYAQTGNLLSATAPSSLDSQAGNSLYTTVPSSLYAQTGNLPSTTAPGALSSYTQTGNSLSATAPSSLDSQAGNLLYATAPSSLYALTGNLLSTAAPRALSSYAQTGNLLYATAPLSLYAQMDNSLGVTTSSLPTNTRLEHAKVTSTNKRRNKCTDFSQNKCAKTTMADALTEPTTMNTIR